MARTLSSTLSSLASQQYGAEPLTVVMVQWASGTRYYTDKTYTFGVNVCEPKILELATITSQLRNESSSDITAISVNLDDSDNTIKNSVNRDLIPGTSVTVYQTFNGISIADSLILLQGRIANDITWSEGTRAISFGIDTAFSNDELGFAPKIGDVANLSKDAAGKLWPIVFGSCVKVPAVQIYKPIKGKLSSFIDSTTASVNIENGDEFPQGVSTAIRTAYGIVCQGTFAGTLFTITDYNIAALTNVTFAARVADADQNDTSVAWITDATKRLQGTYCYATNGGLKYINYCWKQVGAKCWFSKPWKVNGSTTSVLMPGSGVTAIAETSTLVRGDWGDTYKVETITNGVCATVGTASIDDFSGTIVSYGNEVTSFDGTVPTYIVNNAASTAIKGVYAVRDGDLVQVPSSYYTKNLNTTIAGETVTTITLPYPLSYRTGEKWSDDLYVTLVSSLSSNTATVIEYLLDTYSSYTTDSSFTSVAAEITRYPSHFAILDQKSLLDVVTDIAYQARLALTFDGGTARIRYLSKTPATVRSFNDDRIASKSIKYGFQSTDDLVTKYIAKWRTDYYTAEQEYVYKNNQASFGLIEEERDFSIYNIASLVKLSADFWGNRKSNSWRTASWTSFLDALRVEAFDCVSISTSTALATGIRSEVTQTSHDTTSDIIGLNAVLASKSGVHSSGAIVEDMTFFTGGVTGSEATPGDPTDGVAEVDYVVPIEPKDNEPNQKPQNRVVITGMPAKVVRGENFSFNAKIVNDSDVIVDISKSLTCALFEAAGTDTLNLTSIPFVNGTATVTTANVTTDTVDRTAVINIFGDGITSEQGIATGVSEGFTVTSESEPTFTVASVVNRAEEFPFTVANGRASYAYTVTFTANDPAETLKSGVTAFTTFTTDGSGGWTGNLILADGLYALDAVNITVSSDDFDYAVPEILVLDTGAGGNIVVETAVGTHLLYDTVMNDTTNWVTATETDGKTYGIVAAVTATKAIIVCRGFVCVDGLTAHTNYGINLAADGPGFVLRHYESNLCWVGGGSPIARLNQIGDVDASVTLVTGMGLIYDTDKWVPEMFDTLMAVRLQSLDSSITITHASEMIDLKISQAAARSVLGNSTAAVANVVPIVANADGDVLHRAGGVLLFGTIGDDSITGLAWSKLTGVPSTFTPSSHTQAWSTITATPTTLAGYGITDGFTNPMTTAGDMIVGGASGVATRLAGNGGTDIQLLRSISGVTSFATLALDDLSDVDNVPTPAGTDYLKYNNTSGKWEKFGLWSAGCLSANTDGWIPIYTVASGQPSGFMGTLYIGTALSVLGRSAGTAGMPAPIPAGTDNTVLGQRGSALTWAKIDYPEIVDATNCGVPARSANTTGSLAFLTATTNDTILGRRGNTLTWAKVALAEIADMTACAVLGRSANSTGVMAAISASADGQILVRASSALSWLTAPTADRQVLQRTSAGVISWQAGLPAAPSGTGWALVHDGSNISWDQTVVLGNTSAAGSLTISNTTSASAIILATTLITTAGKIMSVREIDVCDAGVAKKMLVLGSAPY